MKVLGISLLLILSPGILEAAVIAFDIQTGTNTQSGFTAVTTFPASDGTVTLSVNVGPSGFRDRGTTGLVGNPNSDLLRDLAFWSTSDPITFTFSGLAINTEYTAVGWAFDSASGNNGKIISFTTNGGTVSHTTNSSDASTAMFTMPNLTSDGAGTATIVMDHTGGAGGAVSLVNGFQLMDLPAPAVIPEPSSAALVGMMAALGLLRRRR